MEVKKYIEMYTKLVYRPLKQITKSETRCQTQITALFSIIFFLPKTGFCYALT